MNGLLCLALVADIETPQLQKVLCASLAQQRCSVLTLHVVWGSLSGYSIKCLAKLLEDDDRNCVEALRLDGFRHVTALLVKHPTDASLSGDCLRALVALASVPGMAAELAQAGQMADVISGLAKAAGAQGGSVLSTPPDAEAAAIQRRTCAGLPLMLTFAESVPSRTFIQAGGLALAIRLLGDALGAATQVTAAGSAGSSRRHGGLGRAGGSVRHLGTTRHDGDGGGGVSPAAHVAAMAVRVVLTLVGGTSHAESEADTPSAVVGAANGGRKDNSNAASTGVPVTELCAAGSAGEEAVRLMARALASVFVVGRRPPDIRHNPHIELALRFLTKYAPRLASMMSRHNVCVCVRACVRGCARRACSEEEMLEQLRQEDVVADLKAALGGDIIQHSKELLFAAVHLLGQVVGDDIGQVPSLASVASIARAR